MISPSPPSLLCELVYNTLQGPRKGGERNPHPGCKDHWFILPVANINFVTYFCLLKEIKKKKKRIAVCMKSVQCVIYSFVATDLYDKNFL